MVEMPSHQYVEIRNGAYYVAGTRIGLDILVHDFRNGRSCEAILDAYRLIGSLAKVYGAVAFVLDHPAEIEAYLAGQQRRYEEIQRRYPLPQDLIDGFERGRSELSTRI